MIFLLIIFLNEAEFIFAQLNGFKHCYLNHILTSVVCMYTVCSI